MSIEKNLSKSKGEAGRPSLKKTMENFMARPWSLSDAEWHLSLQNNVIPENRKLIDLVRQTTTTSTQERP